MVTWAFQPVEGNFHCAAYVTDPAEFWFIVRRGFVTVDYQRADLVDPHDPELCDPVSGFMRFLFRQPFRRLELLEAAA
jgi:hypothetical protein